MARGSSRGRRPAATRRKSPRAVDANSNGGEAEDMTASDETIGIRRSTRSNRRGNNVVKNKEPTATPASKAAKKIKQSTRRAKKQEAEDVDPTEAAEVLSLLFKKQEGELNDDDVNKKELFLEAAQDTNVLDTKPRRRRHVTENQVVEQPEVDAKVGQDVAPASRFQRRKKSQKGAKEVPESGESGSTGNAHDVASSVGTDVDYGGNLTLGSPSALSSLLLERSTMADDVTSEVVKALSLLRASFSITPSQVEVTNSSSDAPIEGTGLRMKLDSLTEDIRSEEGHQLRDQTDDQSGDSLVGHVAQRLEDEDSADKIRAEASVNYDKNVITIEALRLSRERAQLADRENANAPTQSMERELFTLEKQGAELLENADSVIVDIPVKLVGGGGGGTSSQEDNVASLLPRSQNAGEATLSVEKPAATLAASRKTITKEILSPEVTEDTSTSEYLCDNRPTAREKGEAVGTSTAKGEARVMATAMVRSEVATEDDGMRFSTEEEEEKAHMGSEDSITLVEIAPCTATSEVDDADKKQEEFEAAASSEVETTSSAYWENAVLENLSAERDCTPEEATTEYKVEKEKQMGLQKVIKRGTNKATTSGAGRGEASAAELQANDAKIGETSVVSSEGERNELITSKEKSEAIILMEAAAEISTLSGMKSEVDASKLEAETAPLNNGETFRETDAHETSAVEKPGVAELKDDEAVVDTDRHYKIGPVAIAGDAEGLLSPDYKGGERAGTLSEGAGSSGFATGENISMLEEDRGRSIELATKGLGYSRMSIVEIQVETAYDVDASETSVKGGNEAEGTEDFAHADGPSFLKFHQDSTDLDSDGACLQAEEIDVKKEKIDKIRANQVRGAYQEGQNELVASEVVDIIAGASEFQKKSSPITEEGNFTRMTQESVADARRATRGLAGERVKTETMSGGSIYEDVSNNTFSGDTRAWMNQRDRLISTANIAEDIQRTTIKTFASQSPEQTLVVAFSESSASETLSTTAPITQENDRAALHFDRVVDAKQRSAPIGSIVHNTTVEQQDNIVEEELSGSIGNPVHKLLQPLKDRTHLTSAESLVHSADTGSKADLTLVDSNRSDELLRATVEDQSAALVNLKLEATLPQGALNISNEKEITITGTLSDRGSDDKAEGGEILPSIEGLSNADSTDEPGWKDADSPQVRGSFPRTAYRLDGDEGIKEYQYFSGPFVRDPVLNCVHDDLESGGKERFKFEAAAAKGSTKEGLLNENEAFEDHSGTRVTNLSESPPKAGNVGTMTLPEPSGNSDGHTGSSNYISSGDRHSCETELEGAGHFAGSAGAASKDSLHSQADHSDDLPELKDRTSQFVAAAAIDVSSDVSAIDVDLPRAEAVGGRQEARSFRMKRKASGSNLGNFKQLKKSRAEERSHRLEMSLDDVKLHLFMAGSLVHRKELYAKIFSEYWDAIKARVSGIASSRESSISAITKFLRTKALKRLHNKFVLATMRICAEPSIPLRDFTGSPSNALTEKIKPKGESRFIKRNDSDRYSQSIAVPPERFAKQDYSPAYLDPAESQVERGHITYRTSPRIPGATIIDPLARNLCQGLGMKVSENAVWLVVVAMREYVLSVIKRAVIFSSTIASGRIPPPMPSYPQLLSHARVTSDRQNNLFVKHSGGHNLSKYTFSPVDIHAIMTSMQMGAIASLGGVVSRNTVERSLYASTDTCFGRSQAFDDVCTFVTSSIAPPPYKRQKVSNNSTPSAPRAAQGAESKKSGRGKLPHSGLGRGAKDLAAMKARVATSSTNSPLPSGDMTTEVTVPAVPPLPFSDRSEQTLVPADKEDVFQEGDPNKVNDMDLSTSSNYSSSGARRGKGFGVKNLAAMRKKVSNPNVAGKPE